VRWTIILSTIHDINAIKDVFIFVEEYCEIKIDLINQNDEEYISDDDLEYKKIGEILYERGDITKDDLLKLIDERKLFGSSAVKKGLIEEETLQSALSEQKIIREEKRIRKDIINSSTIRVKHHKLDELVNLVGELVTLQLRLSQFSENNKSNELQLISERFERLTTDLRDNTMNLRMVPLSKTFNSFYRLVRDLSNELGKEVELDIQGAETELDKNVIESLKDPLIHIIRNSLDHGIELPEVREKSGKPGNALINITAEYSGANVLIKIADDGAGLNLKNIKEKAVEKGIITSDLEISERDIISLVFAPGFSTAEQTTNISGRGVGMDVVKKNIEKLRGTVEIESKENEGTTVAIKIPLTLAIIDGLLVKAGDNFYVINLAIVEECIDLTKEIKEKNNKKNVINLRNELIPFINLREFFEIDGNIPEIEQLVIIKSINNKIGIKVDNVLGQHQTVIKSVSSVFNNIEEVSGATILGNGEVALILDTNKITERIELETENQFKSVKQI
jgi:two-component system chemotaxis sensor kinase CheA